MKIDFAGERPTSSLRRERGMRGPWLRLLSEILTVAGPDAEFLSHAERPWASVTFSGTRHTITLRFAGIEAILAAEEFIAELPDHEFTIPGQLVADATVTSVEHEAVPEPGMTVEVELLLLENI